MEPFSTLKTVCALLIAAQLALAVPVQWQPLEGGQCASRCRSDPQFIRFSPQHTYKYNIRTQTQLEGATGPDATPIVIEGVAIVSTRSQCDLALQLAEISVEGVEQYMAREMAQQLEATPLFFGYSDGHVTDVCPLIGQDEEWALNVKKAIVSAFQMTSSSLKEKTIVEEADVMGTCTTQYEPESMRYGKYLIKKVKNLRQCSNQQQWSSGFFPRAFQSSLNSIPLLKGKQECEQLIESDLIVGATCIEKSQIYGQMALKSSMNLRLESTRKGVTVDTRERVIMRHAHHLRMSHVEEGSGSGRAEELIPLLRELCEKVQDKDLEQKKSLELFQRLQQAVKGSDARTIENTWQKIESGDVCTSNKVNDLFIDACAQVGSEGSIRVLKREKNQWKQEVVFAQLAFAQNPTKEGLKELLEVLEKKETKSLAILGISGFIRNLKQKENSNLKEIERAIEILLRRALSGGETEERIVAIKALENIGLEESESARKELARIATSSGEKESLRVSALRALDDVMGGERESVIKVFENRNEKNELRILAYKAIVMSGATQREIKRIKQIVEQDKNEHVTQYVLSHQKNLRETSDPHKRDIVLRGNQEKWAEPRNQWWGVSNNHEGSFMIDALGVGAVFEADVIYGEEKAPKSVNLNLTLPLFGREIQLSEFEIRQKGFEREIQNKIQTILNAKNAQQIFDALYSMNTWSSSENTWFEISLKIDGKTLIFFNSKQNQRNFEQIFESIKRQFSQSQDTALAFQPINTRVQLPSTNGFPVIARLNATLLAQIKSEVNSNSALVSPSVVYKMESGIEFRAQQHVKSVGVAFVGQSQPEWESRHEVSARNLNLKVLVSKQRISLFKTEIIGTGSQRFRTGSESKTCTDWTKKLIGLALCFEQNSNSFEIFFEKFDKNLKSFEIQIQNQNQNWRAMFNTPNSEVDRHLEAELQIDNQSEKIVAKMALRSPWKRYTAQMEMRNDQKEQSLKAEVEAQGKKVLSMDVGVEQQSRGQKREFRPRVRVTWQEKEVLHVEGTVGVSKGRKNQLQINLEGNQKQFLKGSFVREGERKSSDIRVSADLALQLFSGLELRVSALLDKGLKHVQSDLALEYRTRHAQKKESMKMSLKLQNLTQSQMMKMSAFAEMTSTQYPRYNTHVAYNLLNKQGEHVENELTVQWDQQLKQKVHFLQLTKVTSGHVENTINVEISPLRVNYELRANGERSGEHVTAEVMGKDRTGNRKDADFKAAFDYKHVQNNPLLLTLNANLKSANNQWEYSDELRETAHNEFKGQTQMAWQSGHAQKKSAKMEYEYRIESKKGDFHHQMDAKIQLPGNERPIRHSLVLRMSRDVKQVKAKLALNDAHNYQLETLLTNQGPSKVEWAGLGYEVRARAHPYQLPVIGSLEVVTPFGEHKSDLEMVPKGGNRYLKIKSDTKRGNRNIFALESELSAQSPSRVRVNSPQFDANFDSDLISDRKSSQLTVNHVNNDWTHSSSFNKNPSSFEMKSKTIHKQRPIYTLEGNIAKNNYDLQFNSQPIQTSVSGQYKAQGNKARAAKVEITCGGKFAHKSEWKSEPEVKAFESSLNDFRNGNPIYNIQYKGLNGKKSFKSEIAQNYGLEGEWTGNAGTGSVDVNARAKREQLEHKSKVNYGNDFYHYSSKTTKSGNNLAEIESKISTNHNKESLIKVNAPFAQTRATIVAIPSKSAKIQIQNSNSLDHATQVTWSPNYSLDSKTDLNRETYALLANHAPKQSFASFKSRAYDISGHVDRDSVAPSAKIQVETPRVSHVTEVTADKNRKWIKVESKSDQKTNNNNIYRLESKYNHENEEEPSMVDLKLNNDFKIRAKINPYNREKRAIQIQVEHPLYNHVTDFEYQPRVSHVTLKSRTDDVISGRNIAKIDSFLSPRDKSHVTVASQSGDCNVEVDPRRSARFELNNNQWNHRSQLDWTPEGARIDSKTKRFGENYLDLNSLIARDLYNDNSNVNVKSARLQSQMSFNLNPKEKSTKIVIKTPSIEHSTHVQIPNGEHVLIDSQTLKENEIWNKLNLNSKSDLQLEIPRFAARGQWSPQHVTLDWKNKLPSERHLLASIRMNPNDKKGFHADFAWDQQKDPNQRVTIDWSAREDSTSGWNQRKVFHSLSASYAGNEIQVESEMTKNSVIYGPHEWTINYVPKYNREKDSMEIKLRHEIKDRQMECQFEYKEANKEKLFATLKTSLDNNNSLITSFTTRAPQNPEMEVKVLVNARATNWRQRNAELMAEVKAVRATQQYSYSIGARRVNENELKGEVKYETPSSGEKQMKFALDYKTNEAEVSLTGSEGKKAEMKAKYDSRDNGEKHVSMDLKSNVDRIPSISVSGDYIPKTEMSFRMDADGARKAEVSVIRTGSASEGMEVSARTESEFWPKMEIKSQFKKNSREIQIEFNSKVDSKQVLSAFLKGERVSDTWSGEMHVSQNGAEVMQRAIDNTFKSIPINYVISNTNNVISPLKVTFSAQTQNKERKVELSACAQQDKCLEVSGALKRTGNRIEKLNLIVSKVGTNLELKASLNEQIAEQTSGQSILGLTSGRTQWKVRNQFSIGVNGHQIGFNAVSQSRGRHQREDHVTLNFPNRKHVEVKSDFVGSDEHVNHAIRIEDNQSEEAILETRMKATQTGSEVSAHLEISSKKFRKSPKTVDFRLEKPTNEKPFGVKLDLNLSQNPNNALTLETHVRREPEIERRKRFLTSGSAFNHTVQVVIQSRDKKKIDFELNAHASTKTLGFLVKNLDKRGNRKHAFLFVKSEETSGAQKRFKAQFETNSQKYAIEGALQHNEKEVSATWNVNDQSNQRTSEQRVAIGNKCVTWESRAQQNRKYELCVNLDNNKEKSAEVTFEETSGGGIGKQFEANLQVNKENGRSVKLDVKWTPEMIAEWIKEWKSTSGQNEWLAEVAEEVYSEIAQKYSWIAQQMSDDVIIPLAALISDDFSDMFQEMIRSFGPFQRLVEISEQFYRQIFSLVDDLKSIPIVQSVNDFYRQTMRSARKQCKRSQTCYQLIYSLENYGIQSISDWLQSNIEDAVRQSHRFVLSTSGRLYRALPVPQWFQQWTQYYRQSIADLGQSIIESNAELESIARAIKELFSEISKDFDKIDSKRVKELLVDVMDSVLLSGGQSSRIVVWDPKSGRLSAQIDSPIIGNRLKRSISETSIIDAKESIKSMLF